MTTISDIFNSRIVSLNDRTVTFTYRKPGSSRPRITNLDVTEFIRRFLQHVLPAGFMKVRHFGFMNSSCSVSSHTIGLMISQQHHIDCIRREIGRRHSDCAGDTQSLLLARQLFKPGHVLASLSLSAFDRYDNVRCPQFDLDACVNFSQSVRQETSKSVRRADNSAFGNKGGLNSSNEFLELSPIWTSFSRGQMLSL